MIRLWRAEWFERTPPIEEVDFGNGRQVSAADLLDGHFHRLTTPSTDGNSQQPSETASEEVRIPVENDFKTAINVVAPTLTPLTELAEEIVETMPEAGPTPHFRDTLNQALTQTHRQQRAQETLGIRPIPVEGNHRLRNWLVVTIVLTVISLGIVVLQKRS